MAYGPRLVVVLLLFGCTAVLIEGRQPSLSLPAQSQQQPEPPRFRVGVDAVRVDAVVTDRDGHIVSDLTADDFEVRQDGKPQAVTFAQFVPVLTSPAPQPSAVGAPGASRVELAIPPPPVKRTDVQRTLAIVVDDLGLSFESLKNTQRALHGFIDRELQPSDLVALVRTGGTGGGLQPFTLDRRVLHTAIDALRWNGASRSGVEPFEPLNDYVIVDEHAGPLDVNDFSGVEGLRRSMSAVGTLGALNLVVRSARELPGRKAVVFVSEGFVLLNGLEPDSRLRIALDRVIEEATRAGVVIYALDCRGLQTAGLQAADNLKVGGLAPGQMDEKVRGKALERLEFNRNSQEGMRYLAEQTGGFAVLNTNDLGRGLGRISNDVRSYYVIGYVPREGTFARQGGKPRLHKIAITVRRPGLHVKTRKAFLGISDPPDTAAAPMTQAQQLVHTATSPFAETGIALDATTLPGYSPAEGMFVRTLLQIDAHGLTFVKGDDGQQTAAADVLGMVFDQEGTEVAHLSTGFAVALKKDAADEALKEGLVYTLRIPIRASGAYQVRFAIRDQHSGALGSAGAFVAIDDIARGAFALSGIVVRGEDGTAAPAAGGADPIALTAAQAIRVYRAGTRLSYGYEVYNGAGWVQAVTSIWHGSEQVFAAPPDKLAVPVGGDRRFAAAGGLKLGEGLPAGRYVLQVSASTPDPKRPARSRLAVQRMAFDVR